MPAKPNSKFMALVKPNETLAAVVGKEPMPRTEITKKIWDYIKGHNLQDAKDKRMINADEKLKKLFGKDQIHMMSIAGVISKNIVK